MAQYKTGTATFTNGSATVTGTDTEWLANVSEGDYIVRRSSTTATTYTTYEVGGVVSDTELTLTAPYGGTTASDASYVISTDFIASGKPKFLNSDVETASKLNKWITGVQLSGDLGTASGYDVGTDDDEIPLNGDLGSAAYIDSDNVALKVDSIEDLSAISDYGRTYEVVGYYTDTTTGGGTFVTVESARHDGVIYFDPSRSDEIGTSSYYEDSGVDTPCYKRSWKGFVTLQDAGGTGVESVDTIAMQGILDNGYYHIAIIDDTTISDVTTTSPVYISGTGTLTLTGTITAESTIEINNLNGVNYSGGDAIFSETDSADITVKNTSITRTAGDGIAIDVIGAELVITVDSVSFKSDSTTVETDGTSAEGQAINYGLNTSENGVFRVSNCQFDGFASAMRAAGNSTFFSYDDDSEFRSNFVTNSSSYGAYFYHTADLSIRNNVFHNNYRGVFIDSAEVIDNNTFKETQAVPSVSAPDDGTVVDLSDSTNAANYRIYNSCETEERSWAVMLYNAARSFTNNKILDNAYDGLVITVDSFKDNLGLIEGNQITGNGRNGVFISPQPRGDSWGGSRRIYSVVIKGGKIAGNTGHAVRVDGRYVESDYSVTYEQIRNVVLDGVSEYENGESGWYDEDGVQSCILKVHNVSNVCDAGLKGVVSDTIVQGSSNPATIHGLYYIDDGDGSPSATSRVFVDSCQLPNQTGYAYRVTSAYGQRFIKNTEVADTTTSISAVAAIGGYYLTTGTWDTSGNEL